LTAASTKEKLLTVTAWLKLVGAVDQPMPDPWLIERRDLMDEVGFTKRADVEIGEELILYAVPQGRIIGLAEVLSHPIRSGAEERWPWRSKIRMKLAITEYSRAPDLADIEEPGGRELSKSVQRQSHIKLQWGELTRARAALEAAFDAAAGDYRS
jgi:hypothetical protein